MCWRVSRQFLAFHAPVFAQLKSSTLPPVVTLFADTVVHFCAVCCDRRAMFATLFAGVEVVVKIAVRVYFTVAALAGSERPRKTHVVAPFPYQALLRAVSHTNPEAGACT